LATQQLFYETATPLTRARHGSWSVESVPGFAFSRHATSVPLTAVEFPFAAPEYPIVFAGSEEAMMPAAILGARQNENLFVGADAAWSARYVPAFVRRYPFVFAASEDRKTLTLCIDESYPGCNQEGRGEKLFDAEGKPTEFVQGRLKFLQEYQAQFDRTLALCKRLRELDLLEPMQAKITLGSGISASVTGFQAVSRDKLKALGADVLQQMVKNDALELIYLHLQSVRNFQALGGKLAGAPAAGELPA
jgi:hypothetical protein